MGKRTKAQIEEELVTMHLNGLKVSEYVRDTFEDMVGTEARPKAAIFEELVRFAMARGFSPCGKDARFNPDSNI